MFFKLKTAIFLFGAIFIIQRCHSEIPETTVAQYHHTIFKSGSNSFFLFLSILITKDLNVSQYSSMLLLVRMQRKTSKPVLAFACHHRRQYFARKCLTIYRVSRQTQSVAFGKMNRNQLRPLWQCHFRILVLQILPNPEIKMCSTRRVKMIHSSAQAIVF